MTTILIVKDRCNTNNKYVIDLIALRWKARGYTVIECSDCDQLPEADIAILHVDATRVPSEYHDALRDYPIVLNRAVLDISKRRISNNIVHKYEKYTGPVIIKTDANSGGKTRADRVLQPESRNTTPSARGARKLELSSITRTVVSRLLGRPMWRDIAVLDPKHYPVLPSVRSVPNAVWKNRNLVVEKFLPEQQDGMYFVRYYMFLGSRDWCGRFGSKGPCVKFSTMATEDQRIPVPRELRVLRSRLGFDYGRVDYVEHDGRISILDANKTVGAGSDVERFSSYLDYLADGIDAFVDQSAAAR